MELNRSEPLCRVDQKTWQSQYRSGAWDYLASSRVEEMHYAVLASMASLVDRPRNILDVGCGEGILLGYLRLWGYDHYLGIDFASVAISNAATKKDNTTFFTVADASVFNTNASFSVIIFCESLGYMCYPVDQLQRYSSMLSPGGAILVSVFLSDEEATLWINELEQRFMPNHSALVSNAVGSWKCLSFPKRVFMQDGCKPLAG
jgi:trans-aconitate methyltransferase